MHKIMHIIISGFVYIIIYSILCGLQVGCASNTVITKEDLAGTFTVTYVSYNKTLGTETLKLNKDGTFTQTFSSGKLLYTNNGKWKITQRPGDDPLLELEDYIEYLNVNHKELDKHHERIDSFIPLESSDEIIINEKDDLYFKKAK